jgi:glucans biosynthesis protein C
VTSPRGADGLSGVQSYPKSKDRLEWIDQLRTLAIVLVVNMHACVTYSHVGGWYIKEGPEPLLLDKVAFVFWQGHLQSFFMGILFLIAGYFAQGSLGRRGPAGFMQERLVRLGLPTLLYMLAIHPLIVFVINPYGNAYGSLARAYARYLLSGSFLSGSGPMWFAAALLVFSALFAGWRLLRPEPPASNSAASAAPAAPAIGIWAAALVATTFLIRTVEPIGQSVMNMQLCYFPQYVLAFSAGIAAGRGGWLQPLARSPFARRCGWAALVLGPVALALVLVASGVLKGRDSGELMGGWHLASLGLSAWEQLAGVGLGLGALSFCSRRLDRSTPLARWLSERSFGVYLLHPPVLILLTLALRRFDIDLFFKVSIATGACLACSFLLADVARRIPGLRAIV